MIAIERLPLSGFTAAALASNQGKVDSDPDPSSAATSRWRDFRRTKAAKEIRAQLGAMCSGLERCMYCEDGQGGHIDHFHPKAHYPSHCFVWVNLLLACDHCNSNFKRDAFPVTPGGETLLIDPTADDPADHLRLSLTTGVYTAVSPKGRHTIEVFRLNREICATGRRDAWISLHALIRLYPVLDHRGQQDVLASIRNHPFQGVRTTLARVLEAGDRAGVVPTEIRQLVALNPELLD